MTDVATQAFFREERHIPSTNSFGEFGPGECLAYEFSQNSKSMAVAHANAELGFGLNPSRLRISISCERREKHLNCVALNIFGAF